MSVIATHRTALLLALAAFFSFSVLNACIKYLSLAGYDVFQIAFFNAVISLSALSLWRLWRWRGDLSSWGAGFRFPLPWLAAYLLLALGACVTLYTAFGRGTFSVISAVVATAPLMVALFSRVFLGESLSRRQIILIAIGLVGMLIIARPRGFDAALPVWLAVVGTCCYAGTQTLVRSRHGRVDVVALTSCFFASVILLMPFLMAMPAIAPNVWGVFLLSGLADAAALILLYTALMRAPAGIVAPLEYSVVVWAGILGYMIWGEWPDTLSLLGILIIVGAGLLFVRTPPAV